MVNPTIAQFVVPYFTSIVLGVLLGLLVIGYRLITD
jgi:hypothetical protein